MPPSSTIESGSCARCGRRAAASLYDGDRSLRNVRVCLACLTVLRDHPEERAYLALVHFGNPRRPGLRA